MGERKRASWIAIAAVCTAIAVFLTYAPRATVAKGPPPTPVPPRGSPSPFPQSLHTVRPGLRPPPVAAKAAVLVDQDSGQVLYAKRPGLRRPVASLTKVMTALLVIEEGGLGTRVRVSSHAARSANVAGLSSLGLRSGERIRVEDLLWALLLQSANDAAIALAEHVGGSVKGFVKDMNRRAARLGIRDTHFLSPNGLNDRGYSTAADLAVVTQAALALPEFSRIVGTKFHTIPAPSGRPRRIQNRNVLLWLYPGATGVKTGFTTKARYNVIASAARGDRSLIAVVLGSPAEPFSDAAELLNYGFKGFDRFTPVEAGEGLGERQIGGRTVHLAAGEGLTVLAPSGAAEDATRRVVLDSGALPIAGRDVGVLRVTAGRKHLGEVPIVVAGVERVPGRPAGWWWTRTLAAVVEAFGGALRAVFG